MTQVAKPRCSAWIVFAITAAVTGEASLVQILARPGWMMVPVWLLVIVLWVFWNRLLHKAG